MKHPIGLMKHDRPSRVVNALAEWNEHLTADALHEKYCKMASSPFVFYRGTAHLFWADFAGDWRLNRFGNARTRTWLQGDAHAENLGAFHNHEGELNYGLNDFDESIVGDYQYDFWRFAISLVLITRYNGGFESSEKAEIIDALSHSYLDTMAELADVEKVPAKVFHIGNVSEGLHDFLKKTKKKASRQKMLKSWTSEKKNGERRFNLELDEVEPASEWEQSDIRSAFPDYRERLSGSLKVGAEFFDVLDIVRRLSAGTGSLGTPRYYALIRGAGDSWKDDRILDVKRQSRPSAFDYLSAEEQIEYRRKYQHDAHRHAVAYKVLGKHPDHLMSWMRLHDGFYSVRERSPFKKTFPTKNLKDVESFVEMARLWAQILAADHAFAARKLKVDGKRYSIAKQITRLTADKVDRRDFLFLVRDQAFGYADQVAMDHGYFKKAMRPDGCEGLV